MSPAGPHHLEDLFEAGGVYGIMKELSKRNLISKKCLNVTGGKLGDILKSRWLQTEKLFIPLMPLITRREALLCFQEVLLHRCNCKKNRCFREGMALCWKGKGI